MNSAATNYGPENNGFPVKAKLKDRSPLLHQMEEQKHVQTQNEPAHEIMALFVLRKLILQMRMGSHQVGLDV